MISLLTFNLQMKKNAIFLNISLSAIHWCKKSIGGLCRKIFTDIIKIRVEDVSYFILIWDFKIVSKVLN